MEEILPGTHQEVWAFKSLKTIAVHYPEMGSSVLPGNSAAASMQTMFFDYEQAAKNENKRLITMISGDEFGNFPLQHWHFTKGAELYDRTRGVQGYSIYSKTNKWTLIFYAWAQWLMATKLKPRPFVMQDQFWSLFSSKNEAMMGDGSRIGRYRAFGMPYDGKMLNVAFYPTASRPNPKFLEDFVEEQDNGTKTFDKLASLSHFPPLDKTTILNEAPPFWTPQSHYKLASWYGNIIADKIDSFMFKNRSGQTVKMSEIVKPFSNSLGFSVDFSPVGMDVQYSIPVDHLNTFEHLVASSVFRGRDGNEELREATSDFPAIPSKAYISYENRDDWILLWAKGGKIPLDPQEICEIRQDYYKNEAYVSGIKRCPYLEEIFELSIAKDNESFGWDDFFDALFQFALIAGGVAASIATNNYAWMISTYAGVMTQGLNAAIPKLSKYTTMAMTFVVTPILVSNYGKPKGEKVNDTYKLLFEFSKASVKGLTESQKAELEDDTKKLIGDMNDYYERDPKLADIITAISYQLGIVQELQKRSKQVTGSLVTPTLQFNLPNLSLTPRLATDQSTSGTSPLLLGAGVVAGALLLKKLLKK